MSQQTDAHFSEYLATSLFWLPLLKSSVCRVRLNRADSVVRMCCDLRPAKMTDAKTFLQDFDDAVSRGTTESCLHAVRHATDLLIAGRYSDDEISTLGEVIAGLADEIEVAARAELATRLAHIDHAPINIIHKLAFDDSIDVAGPVLRNSERLDAQTLVANARTKSQPHLLAISKRKSLEHSVTDVLVTRGNQEVVSSVANNAGARFKIDRKSTRLNSSHTVISYAVFCLKKKKKKELKQDKKKISNYSSLKTHNKKILYYN